AVFGLEVQVLGRRRLTAVVPALTASFVGNGVMHALRGHHTEYAPIRPDLSGSLIAGLVVAGVAFGIVGASYPVLTHALKRRMARWFVWAPWRPFVGGLATIALVLVFGHAYQGLSLPFLADAMSGAGAVGVSVFALKLLFTVVAVGSGFFGGEVTPLFVVGATLGSALATPVGAPPAVFAAAGLCAVFGAAANAPLTCIVMGVELFGWHMIVPLMITCLAAYAVSAPEGVYRSRRAHLAKVAVNLRKLRQGSRRA
ncbi:MAG TPA: chloride channel protein, partial [Ilumatobacteraceae bacterium]|nr:chloride channel protein [Ilumatobacteraceae bacterium]